MDQWFRVFGASDAAVEPAALLEHLRGLGHEVAGHFRGDDEGWFRADFVAPGAAPLRLERYLSSEEGVRAELNTWAAWLETQEANPQHARLMEFVIQTRQVFTLHASGDEDTDEAAVEAPAVAACRFLAAATAGVYQIDGRGFFAADGTPLVPEEKSPPW